jgi:hypothetical protein
MVGKEGRYQKEKNVPLLDVSEEVGLEENLKKTQYMLMLRYRKSG